jgi:hypothetical protein
MKVQDLKTKKRGRDGPETRTSGSTPWYKNACKRFFNSRDVVLLGIDDGL